MRWVKLTLAPVVRASWLLRICRLTSSSRAGTVRTLVAVGTPRLASMLAAIRAAAPRSGVASSLPAADDGSRSRGGDRREAAAPGARCVGVGDGRDRRAGARDRSRAGSRRRTRASSPRPSRGRPGSGRTCRRPATRSGPNEPPDPPNWVTIRLYRCRSGVRGGLVASGLLMSYPAALHVTARPAAGDRRRRRSSSCTGRSTGATASGG